MSAVVDIADEIHAIEADLVIKARNAQPGEWLKTIHGEFSPWLGKSIEAQKIKLRSVLQADGTLVIQAQGTKTWETIDAHVAKFFPLDTGGLHFDLDHNAQNAIEDEQVFRRAYVNVIRAELKLPSR